MIYIGIDPGLSGGIAWTGDGQGAVKMPATPRDIFECLRSAAKHYAIEHGVCLAVIEKLGGMPRRWEKCKACDGSKLFRVYCSHCRHNEAVVCPVCQGQGTISKAQQSPTTMAKLFTNYGILQGVLAALDIPQHEEVLPRQWQADFGLLRRPGETHTAKKNRHKAVAQKIFPTLKVIHATADALLLAEWLRRKELPNAAEAKGKTR